MAIVGQLRSVITAAAISFGIVWTAAQPSEAQPEYAEMTLGNAEASVTVIEYASFTCPHCANFHRDSFGRLKSDYIDTGKVFYVLREVYFDLPGLWAGIVARCGDGTKYFGLVDILFDKQQSWSRAEGAAEIVARLRSIGLGAGLTNEQLDACLADEANAEMLFQAFKGFADQDSIMSTPSFVINGDLYSNMPYEDLAEIIEEKLGQQ